MTIATFLIWGIFGGFAVEGMEFSRVVRATGLWPWMMEGEPPFLHYLISIFIRLLVGGGLALGLGLGHQIVGIFGALTSGIAAPLILEQLSQRVPLGLPAAGDATTSAVSNPGSSMDAGQEEASRQSPKPEPGESSAR